MGSATLTRWLILGFLLTCSLCQLQVQAWPRNRMPFTRRQGCGMFPCAYTHLAKLVGRFAMLRSMMRIISECAHDQNCSPGKRRRRSISRLSDILKRRSDLP